MRHGYGVRASAPFGMASHYRPSKTVRASMTSLRSAEAGGGSTVGGAADPAAERDRRVDDSRGGFVLKARSDEPPVRRRSLVEKGSNIKSIFSVRTVCPPSLNVYYTCPLGQESRLKTQQDTWRKISAALEVAHNTYIISTDCD